MARRREGFFDPAALELSVPERLSSVVPVQSRAPGMGWRFKQQQAYRQEDLARLLDEGARVS